MRNLFEPEGIQIRRIRRSSTNQSKKRTIIAPIRPPEKIKTLPHVPTSIGKIPQGNRPHPDDQEDNLRRQIEAGAKNDYCQAFVDVGCRPQNFIIDEGRENKMQK